ncbi:MAG: helix-turn-helix transcriptional regulator [Bryobacteraceae bacterium]|jgi:transcriptional regulator with XRE-family HTH domain
MDFNKPKQNNLVLYRRRMGFTQRQVARLLGHANTSMVSHYEHGRALPPLPTALGLEIVYRVPVAFLFPMMYDELRREIRKHEETLAAPVQRPLF